MKKLNSTFLYFLFVLAVFSSRSFPQLKKLEGNNLFTESNIFVSPEGVRYSDLITINFNKQIIANNIDPNNIDINSFFTQNVKDYFLNMNLC